MVAILDRQNGRRYGRVQFMNEVVDFIRSAEGRRPCYELLDALEAMRAGELAETVSATLADDAGIPPYLRGATYDLVEGESDAERFDRRFREEQHTTAVSAEYLKPSEAAALLRVNARTVKRWAQEGRLRGFQTPGGHWRIAADSVRGLRQTTSGRTAATDPAVAEIDLGPCASCGLPILAGQQFVSLVDVAPDGPLTAVRNVHVECR
jgi:excisionase family DNA binding protein